MNANEGDVTRPLTFLIGSKKCPAAFRQAPPDSSTGIWHWSYTGLGDKDEAFEHLTNVYKLL
jgi:hypothetical protein